MSLNMRPVMSRLERGPCGKVLMTKTVAHEQLAQFRHTVHDKNLQVSHCWECDSFHIGHVIHNPRRIHLGTTRKKARRRRGGRRGFFRKAQRRAHTVH